MSKYLLLGLLVAGVAVGTYASGGCDGAGARVGVAKDAAIKKIDDLLGPLNAVSYTHLTLPTTPYV